MTEAFTLAQRLLDYTPTLDANVVICDRRVVDEAATNLEAQDAEIPIYIREIEALRIDVNNLHNNYAELLGKNETLTCEIIDLREANKALEAQIEDWRSHLATQCGKTLAAGNQLTASRAECEGLRAALEPFAEAWDVVIHHKDIVRHLSMGQLGELAAHEVSGVHFRNARAALASLDNRSNDLDTNENSSKKT